MRKMLAFTLIELLVVMAIIGTLLAIVAPKYFRSMDHASETALRHDLAVMREAIGNFYHDQNRYPRDLNEMVARGYLRNVPVDPLTGSNETWQLIAPANNAQSGIYDILSGSDRIAHDGTPFSQF